MAEDIYAEPTIFDDAYPRTPYNLDAPPPQYALGPLKTILNVVSKRFTALASDLATLHAQMSVQNATGLYLDAHGVLYNTPRLPGETDDNVYRARILAALFIGKLTIPALQHALTTYLNSEANADGSATPLTGLVYDLQSNPARCAIDASHGFPIKMFQFVVEVDSTITVDDIFFLDYSYLSVVSDDPLTLFIAGTGYSYTSYDSDLMGIITRTKAGDTRPIFKTIVDIDTSGGTPVIPPDPPPDTTYSTYDQLILAEPSVTHFYTCNDAVGSTVLKDAKGDADLTLFGEVTTAANPASWNPDYGSAPYPIIDDGEGSAMFSASAYTTDAQGPTGYATGPAILPASGPVTVELWSFCTAFYAGDGSHPEIGFDPLYLFSTSLGAAGIEFFRQATSVGGLSLKTFANPGNFAPANNSATTFYNLYFAYTWDGALGTFYAGYASTGGGAATVLGTNAIAPQTTGTIILGADSLNANGFIGHLAKLATYDTCLDASRIAAHIAAGNAAATQT